MWYGLNEARNSLSGRPSFEFKLNASPPNPEQSKAGRWKDGMAWLALILSPLTVVS